MKLNIALSGLNATDNPGPGIPVARSIRADKEIQARIIGLSYDNMEPGIYLKDIINKTYSVPLPSSGIASLLERIKYIHSIEKIDVLIPNFDSELMSFIKMEKDLKKLGIKTFLPTMTQLEERHKRNLSEYGQKYKVKVPKSKAIFNVDEITSLKNEFEFPMVVKGKFYEAYTAYTFEQVHTYFHKLNAKWGAPIIIQQFVNGTEFDIAALGDGKGNMIGAVAMKKLVLTDKGKAWAGVTIEDKSMIDTARKIMKATKWKGGMELEVMRDNKKNENYIIEINPRFPAWIYLTAGSGQNLPAALVKMAKGKKVKPFKKYIIGKMFIRYSMDNICNIKDFEKIATSAEY